MRDEASLVARLRAGDRGAFAELVQEHSPRIYGLALRMMQDTAEAEDVLQETILLYRATTSTELPDEVGDRLYRVLDIAD